VRIALTPEQRMRKVPIGAGRLAASRLGFGLSGLHHLLRHSRRQGLLAAAVDSGINYFDVAPYYGHGLAEVELGKFLAGRRSELLVATKFGLEPNPWLHAVPPLMYGVLVTRRALRGARRGAKTAAPRRNYSSANARLSLERSLRALRTDYVDLLFIHEGSVQQLPDPEILFRVLEQFVSQGKVREIGVAGTASDCIALARRWPQLARALQIDVAPGGQAAEAVRAAALNLHASFGHFRSRQPRSMRQLLGQAVAINPGGVILYSTRSATHLRETVDQLEQLEPC
jgi:aryl-alcohol dehydrogenase-like predicted oxidoreductase